MSFGHPYRSIAPLESENAPPPPEDFGVLRTTHVSTPRLGRRRAALAGAVAFATLMFGILVHARQGDLADTTNVLLLLAAFIVLGVLMRTVMPPPHLQIGLFEHGITVVYPNQTWKSMTFEAIDEVWYTYKLVTLDRFTGAYSALVLVSREGRALEVPLEVEDRERVIRTVHVAVTQPLLAEADRSLAAGAELTFGRVRFDSQGIVLRGKRHPWSGVAATFERGRIVLTTNGEQLAAIRNNRVPHPRLFAQLVRRLASSAANADSDQASTW